MFGFIKKDQSFQRFYIPYSQLFLTTFKALLGTANGYFKCQLNDAEHRMQVSELLEEMSVQILFPCTMWRGHDS